MPELHQIVDTASLASLTAGGDDFIRTKDGLVKGLAIRRDLNPEAPEVVLVGKGPQRQKRARMYFEKGTAVPAYVKRGSNRWEYIGDFRAVSYTESASVIDEYVTGSRKRDSIAGVLFLETVTTQTVTVVGGGFPDSKTRKEIEASAVKHAWMVLESRGFKVEDRQPENLGYDLLATKQDVRLLVEVKGTSSEDPRFYITRNEWNVGKSEAEWRLFLVCNARKQPILREYTAPELEVAFEFEALTWACAER